jgi:predicted GNAT family acetyltransferase
MPQILEISDAATFLEKARGFLLEGEGQNNLLLSSAMVLARVTGRSPRLSFFIVLDGKQVMGAALNSTDRRLLLAQSDDATAAFLGEEICKRQLEIAAVMGPGETAAVFSRQLKTKYQLHQKQKILKLESLIDRPTVTGYLRVATQKDLPRLLQWSKLFVQECRVRERPEDTEEFVHRYVENRQFFLWENGRAVAMAGYGGITPNGVRLNMVYTEIASRKRGYAGSLVYVLSRRLLSSGHRFCFLFSDAENAATNRLYETIGYRSICEFSEFHRDRA